MKGPYKWWILRCVVTAISLLVPALIMSINLISPGIIQGSIWGANIGMVLAILVIFGALSMLPSLRGIFCRMTYYGDQIVGSWAYKQGWFGPGALLHVVWLNQAAYRNGRSIWPSAIITVKEIVEPPAKPKARSSVDDLCWKINPVKGEGIALRRALRITILKPAV